MNDVAKVVEISASSSKGIEDAVRTGLQRMGRTIEGIQGAWISDIKLRTTAKGDIEEWRVCMRVSFIVE